MDVRNSVYYEKLSEASVPIVIASLNERSGGNASLVQVASSYICAELYHHL